MLIISNCSVSEVLSVIKKIKKNKKTQRRAKLLECLVEIQRLPSQSQFCYILV